ncbi:MAG: addiction module protein [Verrucomicrobia bacterium]|jgi:putative addiction module component (TIGR02574 family)|nr:addiction module protein [Verrucomicrobiota bacterium]
MSPTFESELRALSPAERILLVEEIWDRIASAPASIPLPAEHCAELDRRLDALNTTPDPGRPWSEVRTELLGR